MWVNFLTVHHHEIKKNLPGGFQTNFEWDIKRVVQIDLFTDDVQSNFGELARDKIGWRLFLFSTFGTQNLWCVAHSMHSAGFKGREK